MKLVHSNGRKLTVRGVGPIIYTLTQMPGDNVALPCVNEIMDDDKARDYVKSLRDTGRFKEVK